MGTDFVPKLVVPDSIAKKKRSIKSNRTDASCRAAPPRKYELSLNLQGLRMEPDVGILKEVRASRMGLSRTHTCTT